LHPNILTTTEIEQLHTLITFVKKRAEQYWVWP